MKESRADKIWNRVLDLTSQGYTVKFYEGAGGDVGVIIENNQVLHNMGMQDFLEWRTGDEVNFARCGKQVYPY